MEESTVRSRQKEKSKSTEKTPDQETEKMFIKNRKQVAENYDFGDVQKIPANVRDIMDKNFSRLFTWELYFGKIYYRFLWFSENSFCLGYIFWTIFFGIGPMVMFFPMVKLAIHGYEVLILSLASPIILGSSFVNNIAEVSWFIFALKSFNLNYFLDLEHCWKINYSFSCNY